ncbi:hypothetical protein E0D83_26855 [Klebsiella grimontii]|nr:hypothetical protein E0D83_26855 [Klebsiella grimontii]
MFRAQATARLGRRIRNGCCKPALDLSHQTLASARNRLRVRRSLAGAQQLPLAEWGSTTEQRQLIRSRRGPAYF